MYLKRLEMYGFKSFADKTVLEFMPGITTVIGPNGSGKSNISDCIRWILGEQSMKSLRGQKSEDIIFSGTQNRRSLGFAEGSIVIDNSDGSLPIDYSEVVITRRIYRSGETGYFINKTPCRLKDILELFMDTGIGRDGYSIIGQGKIDEILSNKSEDRRHIFEEAAGIVKYRTRKAESEKKLEQTKLNLLRINDIISEIEGNIGPLKEQSETAKKFLDLRENLKSIEVGLFLYNIDDFKAKIEEVKKNVEVFEIQKVKEEEKLNNINSEKENLKKALDELLEQIEQTQNLGFEGDKKKEQINSEIGILQERISNNKENYDRYLTEIGELEEKNKTLEEEKLNKINKKTNLVANKEKFDTELKQKEEELAKYSANLSEKEIEIESKKLLVQTNIDNKYEMGTQISTQKANFENLNKKEESLKDDLQDTISELDEVRAKKSDTANGFHEIESKRNEVLKALDEIKEKREESDKKIAEFDLKINNLDSEYRIKEARQKFLIETEKEKEGYGRTVKSLLQDIESNSSLNKGVCGVLANLISVDSKYETAIEMALGSAMQNIVTETEQEAKKLVNHLRENNLGRASFLPISSVKEAKIGSYKKVDGVIGIASELVETNKKYEKIISNLLGRTIVVDDMDSAIALAKKNAYSFRIVTLKGDIINPSGAISGGSVAKKTVSILGRGKEIKALEKELKNIETKKEKLLEEKEQYIKSVSEILSSFDEKQAKLQEIEIVFATENQKQENFNLEILKLETKRDKIKADIENLKTEREENLKLQEELNSKILKIDEENSSLNKIIEEFAELNKDTQRYIDDLNFDITNLKISVSSFDESETSINEILDRLDSDIANNIQSIENKKASREKIITDNMEFEQKIEDLKKQIEELEKEVANSGIKVEELKEERQKKNEKIEEIEKQVEEIVSIVDDVKTQISKLEVKESKYDLELNQVINKMWEEYELTPNNVGDIEKIENPTKVQKEVNSLRSEIRDLGPVNVNAIKEYQELKDRYDFMSEQRLDLEDASSKLKKVIAEMTDTMKKQFAQQFKIINKNFGEVFAELFGGGRAELKLEDSENILECGIEIEVEPPGKKLQNMMLLSGGEKAFTAIALLFAILKINPAPFCVLDEIEAALDDVNVFRFAEYLKKFTDKTQFLVITHRKGTMEVADTVYGITMEEKGISKLLSMKLSK